MNIFQYSIIIKFNSYDTAFLHNILETLWSKYIKNLQH